MYGIPHVHLPNISTSHNCSLEHQNRVSHTIQTICNQSLENLSSEKKKDKQKTKKAQNNP